MLLLNFDHFLHAVTHSYVIQRYKAGAIIKNINHCILLQYFFQLLKLIRHDLLNHPNARSKGKLICSIKSLSSKRHFNSH